MPQKNASMAIFSVAVFAVLTLCFAVAFLQIPNLYFDLIMENHFGEWAQFFLFFVSAIIFAKSYLNDRDRLAYAIMALALFFVAMEEISWGQQIFGWMSPEFFAEKNLQSETNLHNFIIGAPFLKVIVFFKYAFAGLVVFYGTLYGLLASNRWKLFDLLDRKIFPAPPIYLAPFFLFAGLGITHPIGIAESEFAEMYIGVAMLIFAIVTTQTKYDKQATFLALCAGGIFAFVAAQAYATSNVAVERIRDTASRKFEVSNRYFKFGMFDQANTMVSQAQKILPRSIRLLHLMYEIDLAKNEEGAAIEHLVDAAMIGEARTAANPKNIQSSLLNVKTFQLLGDEAYAAELLEKTLGAAQSAFSQNPESHNAAFDLGAVHAAYENTRDAIRMMEMAVTLDPSNRTYQFRLHELKSARGNLEN